LDNPINYFIQNDIIERQLNGTGLDYNVIHEWKTEYGTGDGSGSDNEDIANAKPKVIFENGEVIVYSYTHDHHQQHPQFVGRNEVTAILTNMSSVDIQMKFKNQKWIGREIGEEKWEEIEVDTCDTYQKIFYSEAFKQIESNMLQFYDTHGCPVDLAETITTGCSLLK